MRVIFLLLLFLSMGCKYPQDPRDSFQEAKAEALEVGVVENPPFAYFEEGEPEGKEIDIIKELAREYDLQVNFHHDSESDLLHRLEKNEIHLVLGGFTKSSIWKKKAGLTAAYDNKHVFLITKGENRLLYKLENFIFKRRQE